jgi:hypothetical protein
MLPSFWHVGEQPTLSKVTLSFAHKGRVAGSRWPVVEGAHVAPIGTPRVQGEVGLFACISQFF